MTKIASLLSIAVALLAFGLSAAPAQEGPSRTFVSGHGTDTGTCALAAPCRTFAFALTQTAAGGEIDVLDPAEYGTVTITQAISIVNNGAGVAAIESFSENAITINAGPSDSVYLRGLTIERRGGGLSGIRFNTGGTLAIENCVIRDFVNSGINLAPSTSSSFSVSNTIVSNSGHIGIRIHPAGAAVATGVLRKVTANNNLIGIGVLGAETTGASLKVTIADSEASNNGNLGVIVFSGSGHAATAVTVRNVVASNNISFGLAVGRNAILRVAHSKVTGNGTGLAAIGGGILNSYGDNDIDGNGFDGLGYLTPISTH